MKICQLTYRGYNSHAAAIWGTQVSCTDERSATLVDLAAYFTENLPQYAKGAHYLLQLAGKVAVKRTQPTKLSWILSGPVPGIQRGNPLLKDPELHNVRRLHVKFHRYYWWKGKNEGTCGWGKYAIHNRSSSNMESQKYRKYPCVTFIDPVLNSSSRFQSHSLWAAK